MQDTQPSAPTLKRNAALALLALLLAMPGAYGGVSLSTVVSFDETNGAIPLATLVQAKDGWLYGNTCYGGAAAQTNSDLACGTLFKVSPNGAFVSLLSFNQTNGSFPRGPLVAGADGALYGTTDCGGPTNAGTVFRLTTNGVLTTLFSFHWDDGQLPDSLIQGNQGELYGTTGYGGRYDWGTVFKITTNGVLTTLAWFDGTNGCNPNQSALVQGADGTLYGTTRRGGPQFSRTNYGWGTVFKVSPNGGLTCLVAFNGTNGADPISGLVAGPGGCLYGSTFGGGLPLEGGPKAGNGTLFKVTPKGRLTTLHRFAGYPLDGARPGPGALTRGSDGNYYGATSQGGVFARGLVFQMTPAGKVLPLVAFNDTQGRLASTGLVEASRGVFYGVTVYGGAFDQGTVYRFTLQRPFNRPVVSIRRSPARWKQTNGPITVQGRAWGKQSVQQVLVQSNDNAWSPAVTTNQWKNWTADLNLAPGKNTVRACAVDTNGVYSIADTAKFHLD